MHTLSTYDSFNNLTVIINSQNLANSYIELILGSTFTLDTLYTNVMWNQVINAATVAAIAIAIVTAAATTITTSAATVSATVAETVAATIQETVATTAVATINVANTNNYTVSR